MKHIRPFIEERGCCNPSPLTPHIANKRLYFNYFKELNIHFNGTVVTLAANASVKVMIPIMPVGSDHKFTIQVKSHAEGQSKSYLKSQSQPESGDHSLTRNQLGYAPISIVASGTTTDVLAYDAGMYLIRTPLDFILMMNAIENQWLNNSANYKLMEDIDMSNQTIFPITNNILFCGLIDGNGHSINNLTIKSKLSSSDYTCALFKQTSGGTRIQNITFDNLKMEHLGLITNKLIIAGLIATFENTSTLTLSNCTINYSAIIIDSTAGNIYFGGLIGESSDINISNCHVTTPTISLKGKSIGWGGLIAARSSYSNTNIYSSSWTGSITKIKAVKNFIIGGLIGNIARGNLTATSCTITGRIETSTISGAKQYIGSIVGEYNNREEINTTGTNTSSFTASKGGTELNDISFFGTNLAK